MVKEGEGLGKQFCCKSLTLVVVVMGFSLVVRRELRIVWLEMTIFEFVGRLFGKEMAEKSVISFSEIT